MREIFRWHFDAICCTVPELEIFPVVTATLLFLVVVPIATTCLNFLWSHHGRKYSNVRWNFNFFCHSLSVSQISVFPVLTGQYIQAQRGRKPRVQVPVEMSTTSIMFPQTYQVFQVQATILPYCHCRLSIVVKIILHHGRVFHFVVCQLKTSILLFFKLNVWVFKT